MHSYETLPWQDPPKNISEEPRRHVGGQPRRPITPAAVAAAPSTTRVKWKGPAQPWSRRRGRARSFELSRRSICESFDEHGLTAGGGDELDRLAVSCGTPATRQGDRGASSAANKDCTRGVISLLTPCRTLKVECFDMSLCTCEELPSRCRPPGIEVPRNVEPGNRNVARRR